MITEKKILAYTLANALAHDGKAQAGAVLPKLFQEGLRKEQIKNVLPIIQRIIKKVNSMSIEEQKEEFNKITKSVKIVKRKEKEGLPELENAKKNHIIMRFAPYPSGPLHLGNARPAVLNDEYCKMYNGKLFLVIDDTIGSEKKQIVPEAYKLIPEALNWLGIKYKEPIIYKSDRLELYYKYASKLIEKGKAYVCFCSSETLHKNRILGKECKHRKASIKENLKHWNEMLDGKYKEGEATLRIKTNMKDKNPAFRDRVLFRISNRKHPRVGNKYKVWPLLEFSWAIDDHFLGITHILRGKDLIMESKMEKYLWDIFGWEHSVLIHTGLVRIKGVKISKSKSSEEVLSGKYFGWDDPRTWSIQSLKRRGIRAKAIRLFCLSLGLTQTESVVPIENLYKENKKIVESSNRYFFIVNPVKIKIKNAPMMKARIPLHPDHLKRGYRNFTTGEDFYITKEDFKNLKKGKIYRLMHLFNFIKDSDNSHNLKFLSKEYDPDLKAKLIHWLPAQKKIQKDLVKTEIMMPNAKIEKGLAESSTKNLTIDSEVQFERFGFCRLDKKEKNKIVFWFSHK